MDEPVAIAFASEGEAAKINYSIPMPGAHTGRRVMEIKLDLQDNSFTPGSLTLGSDLADVVGVSRIGDRVQIDEDIASQFFADRLGRAGLGASAGGLVAGARPLAGPRAGTAGLAAELRAPGSVLESPVLRATGREIALGEVSSQLQTFLVNLTNDVVHVPAPNWAGTITLVPRALFPPAVPRFFLVERYGISSFLGDYGMGRTVKTFTLLPGESMTISLKTWQSTAESVEQSSSIIDSHEQSARDRFAEKVQSETTDKATSSQTEEWHVEASVSASWGFGSAKVSGGGSGEYHSGREQFARQAGEATVEHAAEASSKRELSVSSSSEKTTESGTESLIERTITNVNVRRVLNFVFRELNQTYVTKLHLKDVRVAFTNGRLDSWREVPLSGLRQLLAETVSPDRVDRAAQQILRVAGTVFDHDDTAVQVLDRVTIKATGDGADVEHAERDNDGDFAPPTDDVYYRFRPGPLAQGDDSNPVDGVLLRRDEITMRTDSVVVEALLGQADALDAYAMEIQAAAASKETLANERERLILDTLIAIADPVQRAELGAKLLGTCCPAGDG